jgi:hypothetical protein
VKTEAPAIHVRLWYRSAVAQDDPWLRIPAADYEAHMEAVGQSAALRDLFGRVYAEASALTGRMKLRTADEVAALATREGFGLAARRTVRLPSGKKLVGSLFDKARKPLDRRRGRARC